MHDRRKCLISRGWLTQLDTSTNNNNNHTHTPTPTYTRMYTQPSTKSTLSMLARTLCLPEWVEFLVEGRRNEASRKSRYVRDTALYRNSTAAAHRKRRWITLKRWTQFWKLTSSWRVQIATTFTIPQTHHHLNWVNRQCLQILAHAPHPLPLYHTQSLCNTNKAYMKCFANLMSF